MRREEVTELRTLRRRTVKLDEEKLEMGRELSRLRAERKRSVLEFVRVSQAMERAEAELGRVLKEYRDFQNTTPREVVFLRALLLFSGIGNAAAIAKGLGLW